MATLDKLLNAQPRAWIDAAKDWRTLAGEAERSAAAIYQNGTQPLQDAWRDPVGKSAAEVLTRLADQFRATAASTHGVALVLEGLGTSVETLQQRLRIAINDANRAGATVNPDGSVQLPPNTLADRYAAAVTAGKAILAVLGQADRLDDQASQRLGNLAGTVGQTDHKKLLDQAQGDAAVSKIDIIRAGLPDGTDPGANRAWWDSLTDQQRKDLERAVPVALYDMPGIPRDVRERLAGDGTYNRVELVRWAERNWNNTGVDIFSNNCAHFVSTALENAGLEQKSVPGSGAVADAWERGAQSGVNWLDRFGANSRDGLPMSYTPSWAHAASQYSFMTSHGGSVVPLGDALPGDLIYFQNATGSRDVYHVSLVTSVTPDGDIHYTQHTDERLNASLNGRLPQTELQYGDVIPHIVRLKPTW